MAQYAAEEKTPSPGVTAIRRVVAVVVLVLVVIRVLTILADYQSARVSEDATGSSETSSSVDATETSGGAEGAADEQNQGAGDAEADSESGTRYVVVVIPGLNFREEPKSNADVIRTLPEGTRLTLLGEQNGWYQVRDEDGVTGWVSSDAQYVKIDPE